MTEEEIFEAWRVLCDWHEELRQEDWKWFARVNSGQAAVALGDGVGASEAEIAAWEKSGQALEQHREVMREFVRKYARGKVG